MKRTIHVLVDDIDGGDADETVRFVLDGVQYEIDLSTRNAARFREAMAPYTAAGSRVVRPPVSRGLLPRSSAPLSERRQLNDAARAWARSSGHKVADRGRVPQRIMDAYLAARDAGAPAA